MNYLILISFLVVILSILIFAFPWKFVLRFGYIEEYCADCVPKKAVVIVRLVSAVFLMVSLMVFFFEITLTEFDWEFYKNLF